MEEQLAKSKLPLVSCFPFLPYTRLLVLMSLVDGLPLKQWRLVPRVQQVARYCLLYCLQEKRRMNSLGFFIAYGRIRTPRIKIILFKKEGTLILLLIIFLELRKTTLILNSLARWLDGINTGMEPLAIIRLPEKNY